jgi:TctA family transporter
LGIAEIVNNLAMGFDVAFSLQNFMYCLIGATVGTLVGVLPGISPITAIAMLLPITFKIPAIGSLIMLCGIYYGAHHAGSTTAIMLNMPGEPTSVVICMDGHPMARQGRAGVALCISAIAATFAGAVGVIIVAALSPMLAAWALHFESPEYAAIVVLALVVAAALQGRPMAITISMALFGLLLGTVGTDGNTGILRLTFGIAHLSDGVDLIAVAIGLFAIPEMISQVGAPPRQQVEVPSLRGLVPTRADFHASWKPILRGTFLGSLIGIFPSTGPLLSSFVAYALERKIAKDPSRFGEGAIKGVAGPEAANNAATVTHFIPMLTLGIPAGPAMALMLSAMLIQGITPGPDVMTKHPDLFWGIIASMWIGN